jgi:hypothetical protein
VRKPILSVAGWAFGMAVTILFIALWGRAVVADTEALGESLSPLATSQAVIDSFAEWMADQMVEEGVDPALIEPTIDHFVESSRVTSTLELLIAEVVDAAGTPSLDGATVNMQRLLTPAVPEVTAGLAGLGVPIAEAELQAIVDDLDPMGIREPGSAAIVGPESATATRLGTASVLAVLAMGLFGYLIVSLSEDRVTAVRTLLTRVAVGGVGFAILLRVGSWVLDPGGGRAPVPDTLSLIARSKWMLPFQMAVAAGVVAGLIYAVRRIIRRAGVPPSADEPATLQPERELSLSRSD